MGLVSSTETRLLQIVGDIYDCAIEPKGWPEVLDRLTQLVDGEFAAISLHDTTNSTLRLKTQWNIPGDFEAGMRDAISINPLVPFVWYFDVDRPYTALGQLGADELTNSRWFRNAVAPFGVLDAAAVLLAKSSRRFGAVSIFRDKSKAAFDPAAIELLGHLAPHIRRAVMISDMLDARALERDMISATLEMLSVGIVLTDECGRMIHANNAALKHLDDAGALRRDGSRLSARDPKAAAELRQAIAEAASGSTVDIPQAGISVPVGDLAAWVLPLDGGLRREFAATFSAKAVVFVREIGVSQPLPAELFVRRYGVTPAECRILMLLAQGMTISEAADTLGIAFTTAKTHLMRLFQKTGTQRQAALVRLAGSAFAPASTQQRGNSDFTS